MGPAIRIQLLRLYFVPADRALAALGQPAGDCEGLVDHGVIVDDLLTRPISSASAPVIVSHVSR